MLCLGNIDKTPQHKRTHLRLGDARNRIRCVVESVLGVCCYVHGITAFGWAPPDNTELMNKVCSQNNSRGVFSVCGVSDIMLHIHCQPANVSQRQPFDECCDVNDKLSAASVLIKLGGVVGGLCHPMTFSLFPGKCVTVVSRLGSLASGGRTLCRCKATRCVLNGMKRENALFAARTYEYFYMLRIYCGCISGVVPLI